MNIVVCLQPHITIQTSMFFLYIEAMGSGQDHADSAGIVRTAVNASDQLASKRNPDNFESERGMKNALSQLIVPDAWQCFSLFAVGAGLAEGVCRTKILETPGGTTLRGL